MTAGGHGFDGVERRGLMFVLSSPSGAGKTTLSRLLIQRTPGLRMSVSATTRPMRPGEVDGSDYHFIDAAKFEQMTKRNDLLEWATVFDNRSLSAELLLDALRDHRIVARRAHVLDRAVRRDGDRPDGRPHRAGASAPAAAWIVACAASARAASRSKMASSIWPSPRCPACR